MKLFAPGKVFLAGEYAVLEGHPALVAGVDAGLSAQVERAARFELARGASLVGLDEPPPPELRFAHRALAAAVARYRPAPLRLTFLDDLATGGQKLGLGGSAAATVLAVRAAAPTASPEELLPLAVESHWVEQGQEGSGADVAASLFGGILTASSSGRPPVVGVRRLRAPADLRLLLAFAGTGADTRALVREVRTFARNAPSRWRSIASDIAAASSGLAAALESGARDEALAAVHAGRAAMAALGKAAGVPIVTDALARACAAAENEGAAGKPSGAGGGDCAVMFCFGDAQLGRVEAALRGFFTLRVRPV